jgi:hypothetical protein
VGCVLQPGEDIPAAALKPGDTTSDSVQPGQEIDVCVTAAPPGNLTMTNIFENSQSFGTDQSECGIRMLANGNYQWSAEASFTPFWNDQDFGTEWIDDGGASAEQFEARVVPLNIGSLKSPVWVGWSGFNEWQPCNQTLQFSDQNGDAAPSAGGFIVDVEVREIAVPGNTDTSQAAMTCTNDP